MSDSFLQIIKKRHWIYVIFCFMKYEFMIILLILTIFLYHKMKSCKYNLSRNFKSSRTLIPFLNRTSSNQNIARKSFFWYVIPNFLLERFRNISLFFIQKHTPRITCFIKVAERYKVSFRMCMSFWRPRLNINSLFILQWSQSSRINWKLNKENFYKSKTFKKSILT